MCSHLGLRVQIQRTYTWKQLRAELGPELQSSVVLGSFITCKKNCKLGW